jgi:hypothetical protein
MFQAKKQYTRCHKMSEESVSYSFTKSVMELENYLKENFQGMMDFDTIKSRYYSNNVLYNEQMK